MWMQRLRRVSGDRVRAGRLGVALCLFAGLVVGSLWLQACSSDDTTSTSDDTTSTSANLTTTTNPLVTGEMKEEMSVAGWKIIVDGVESKDEVDGVKAGDGQELLVVDFTVVNTTSRPTSLTVEDLSLRGEDGSSYRAIDTGTGLFALAAVPAEGRSSTFVVFKVPTDATGLKLHFQPFVEAGVSPREADITVR